MYGRLKRLSSNPHDVIVHNEFLLETIRQKYFPDHPSRLGGLYFFENAADAIRAHGEWGFCFSQDYLSEISFNCSSYCRVDSEWITHCIDKKTGTDWMVNYWSGAPYGDTPLYEIVAEGFGVIKDLKIRNAAYSKYFFQHRDTTPLLSMACCAFSKGGFDNIAQVTPFLSLSDNIISGSFLINMHDFNTREKEIVDKLGECAKNDELPLMVLPKDENAFFRIPDLNKRPEYTFKLQLTKSDLNDIAPHFNYKK